MVFAARCSCARVMIAVASVALIVATLWCATPQSAFAVEDEQDIRVAWVTHEVLAPSTDQDAANEVAELIQSLPEPGKITLDDKAAVEKARAAFDALTETQFGYLPEHCDYKLSECEKRIAMLEQEAEAAEAARIDIATGKVTLSTASYTYNGKAKKPTATLVVGGKTLKLGVDYTVAYASNVKAGTAKITLTGIGTYKGAKATTFTIKKAANSLKVAKKTATVKYSSVKKKAQTLKVGKVLKFTNKGQGTLSYAKKKGNKKIVINKKTGKVTLKKGLKKGTYKVTVAVKAAGNGNYKAKTVKVTFVVKVK